MDTTYIYFAEYTLIYKESKLRVLENGVMKGRGHLEDLGVDGRITLIRILKI
jgi:hypothetical protein